MNKIIKLLQKGIIPLIVMAACSVAAATPEINEAVKKYYAGSPDEAIGMLKPLALSGDADAQYLLGNILYSLSKTGKFGEIDDPVKWYKMAAAQQSIGANYALGNIFHDRWLKSPNQQDAANAIVYYQRTVDSGYTKAQVSLDRIKSRSGMSQRQAVALAKQPAAPPAPQDEVQLPQQQAAGSDSDETAAAASNSAVQDNTAVQPASGAKVQLPQKQAASLDSDETPAAVGSSTVQDDTAVEMVAAEKTMASESSVEPETDVAGSQQIAQITDEPGEEEIITITLAEIAGQCQNFTEEGFALYAKTIQDALFSGKASLVSIRPDASKQGTYLTKLANSQYGIVIFLDLQGVPEAVATSFAKGIKYDVSGPVVAAKAIGSNCTVNLIYQSVSA